MFSYVALRDFCKKSVLALAIAFSVTYLFDIYSIFTSIRNIHLLLYYGEYSFVLNEILNLIPGIFKGLVLLDLWLIFGRRPGGGGIIKVVSLIMGIFMFIALGICVIATTAVVVESFVWGYFESILYAMLLGGIMTFVILFYAFLSFCIKRSAGDINLRLRSDNTQYVIAPDMPVKLGKYLVTYIVFAGIGLLVKIIFNIAIPYGFSAPIYSTVPDMLYNFSPFLGNYIGNILYRFYYGGWYHILGIVLNITLCGFGLAVVGSHKKLVKGE